MGQVLSQLARVLFVPFAAVCALGVDIAGAFEMKRLAVWPLSEETPVAKIRNEPLNDRLAIGLARYAHFVLHYTESRQTRHVDIVCRLFLPGGRPATSIQKVRDRRTGEIQVAVPIQVRHRVEVSRAWSRTPLLKGFGPFTREDQPGTYEIECEYEGEKLRAKFQVTPMSVPEVSALAQKSVVEIHFEGPAQEKSTPLDQNCRSRPVGRQGTGFAIDARGHILTNAHVSDACAADWPVRPVFVVLPDGRRLPAVRVGSDASADIAVLRIAAGTLPALALAPSVTPRVGEDVVAVGFPIAGAPTTTRGIVSAVRHDFPAMNRVWRSIVQTDAPFTFGNSGGPLLTLFGEVVGVNTFIVGARGGLNFSVKADWAHQVATRIIAQAARP